MTKIVNNIFDDLLEKPKWYENIYYSFVRKVKDVKYFFRKIYQRIKYGFPLEQAWEFRSWHAEIVVPRLKYMRDHLTGHPFGLTREEWEAVLSQMIWSFENIDNYPSPIYSSDFDRRYEVIENENSTTYKSMNKTGTIDCSPLEKHNKQIASGLNLFAEYYEALWD